MISRREALKLSAAGLISPLLTLSSLDTKAGDAHETTKDWPIVRGNPARTGSMPGKGLDPDRPIVAVWEDYLGGSPNAPVVASGNVYITNSSHFHVLDAETGVQHWFFLPDHWAESSATVMNGVAYFGVGFAEPYLLAMDVESRTEQWRFPTSRHRTLPDSPLVVDGVVYVNDNASFIYAITADSGDEQWRFTMDESISHSTRTFPALADGVLYAGDTSNLYAIDADSGSELWRFPMGYANDFAPAVANGTVYIGNHEGNFYALDASSGEELWRFSTGDMAYSLPVAADDTVFVRSESDLYAIDVDSGNELWRYYVGDMHSSPTLVDGFLYVCGSDGYLYMVEAVSGEEIGRGRMNGSGPASSSPAVSEGRVYVTRSDGKVYAFGNP